MHKWMKLFILLCLLVLVAPGCSKKKGESKPDPESKTVDLGESDADNADNAENADKDKNKDKDTKDNERARDRAKKGPDKKAGEDKNDSDGAKADNDDAKDPDAKSRRNKRNVKAPDAPEKDGESDAPKQDNTETAEGVDFGDMDAEDTAAPAPKPPRQPKVREGMSIEKLINIRELREQTGYSGTLQEAWLLGQNPDNRYNAMRLATDKSDELGFAVQVWKPGNETAAAKRFTDLFSQSFGGQKIKNVATDAFISTHHKLNELCFFEKSKKATVLISCTESVCSSEQLKSVAQIIQRRL